IPLATDFGLPIVSEILSFERNVDIRMESRAIYREDLSGLHVVDPVTPDVRIYYWSDLSLPRDQGYAFRQILKEVDRLNKDK
ncbi:MAG TPA: hypothetical protein VJ984_02685, partial [Xanthomonadales bacterium]|nr:hypothetical protein [Xanthomonadales bacterium]